MSRPAMSPVRLPLAPGDRVFYEDFAGGSATVVRSASDVDVRAAGFEPSEFGPGVFLAFDEPPVEPLLVQVANVLGMLA